jgi:ketosteroid isomerase-like protein
MTAGNGRTTAEVEIRALIDEQAKAIRAKDVDRSLSGYAPDLVLFDVVDPLRSTGWMSPESAWPRGSLRSAARSATRFTTSRSWRATTWPSATP